MVLVQEEHEGIYFFQITDSDARAIEFGRCGAMRQRFPVFLGPRNISSARERLRSEAGERLMRFERAANVMAADRYRGGGDGDGPRCTCVLFNVITIDESMSRRQERARVLGTGNR